MQVLLAFGMFGFAVGIGTIAWDFARSRDRISAVVFGVFAVWLYTAGFTYLLKSL